MELIFFLLKLMSEYQTAKFGTYCEGFIWKHGLFFTNSYTLS